MEIHRQMRGEVNFKRKDGSIFPADIASVILDVC